MPIHEFACQSCGRTFELLIMTKDEVSTARCPLCQSPEVHKLMSAASFAVNRAGGRAVPETAAPSAQHRSCGGGSCATFDLPGHKRP